jgi:hypothetical protein
MHQILIVTRVVRAFQHEWVLAPASCPDDARRGPEVGEYASRGSTFWREHTEISNFEQAVLAICR